MSSQLSDRVQRIKPSATIAVTARAAALRASGIDVIGLGAGEPDFDTPDHIKRAANEAIAQGFTKYTAVDGIAELKTAIINKFRRDNELEYEPNQILVSTGAKQTIFNMVHALINAGDEVVIPAPCWVSYPDIVKLAGGTPVIPLAGADQAFKISASQLADALTPKTRLLMLNSPCNPTGASYTRAELAAMGEVLKDYPDVVIGTDDMYEHIFWDAEPFCSFAQACPDLADRTVTINGVSKAYAMTGWRIGYCGGPADLVGAMKKLQSQSTSNACSIAQKAAAAALAGDQACVGEMTKAFRERHDFVVGALNEVPGFSCAAGAGTFYAFPEVGDAVQRLGLADDAALAEHLIEKARVALVPGSAFEAPGYLRLSFATDMDTLKTAIGRIQECLST